MNVTHKKPYRRYEGKTNGVLIAFIGYVNDLNKLQQFKVKKVNVNFFRYRPSVAQRVGRGIALLFHERGTRRR